MLKKCQFCRNWAIIEGIEREKDRERVFSTDKKLGVFFKKNL